MATSEAITNGIRVRVVSQYLPDHAASEPRERQWFFTYTVRITNEGLDTVQLMSRHWIITDANGHDEEVRGPGVVGAQPVLAPGDLVTEGALAALDVARHSGVRIAYAADPTLRTLGVVAR